MTPNNKHSKWVNICMVALSLLLFVEVLIPALNKLIWYDDVDALLLGRLEHQNRGLIDDAHAVGVHPHVFNGDGESILYQPGWVYLNMVIDAMGISHATWRGISVLFIVLALVIYARHRLTGFWQCAPLLLALFSDFMFRSAGLVRSYNLSALGLVLCCVLMQSDKRKLFWLSVVFLWQINILAWLAFMFCHFMTYVSSWVKKEKTIKESWPVMVFYASCLVFQYFYNIRDLMSGGEDVIAYSMSTRFQSALMMHNAFLVPLVLLPLLLWRRHAEHDIFRYVLLFTLLISPIVFKNFRPVYFVIFAPLLWVDLCSVIKSLKPKWALTLVSLVIFTAVLSLPVHRMLNYQPDKVFYDQIRVGDRWINKAPMVAFFESRYRKWSEDEALIDYVTRHKKEGDHILFETSQSTAISHLSWKESIPVTALFPEKHLFAQKNPDSLLVNPTTPFWALSPRGKGVNPQIADEVKRLSVYGRVTVHQVPERKKGKHAKGYHHVSSYPPEIISNTQAYTVYYVE